MTDWRPDAETGAAIPDLQTALNRNVYRSLTSACAATGIVYGLFLVIGLGKSHDGLQRGKLELFVSGGQLATDERPQQDAASSEGFHA